MVKFSIHWYVQIPKQHLYVYVTFYIIIITMIHKTKHIKVHVFVYLHITITYILMCGNACYFQFAKQLRHVDKMGILVLKTKIYMVLRLKYQMFL